MGELTWEEQSRRHLFKQKQTSQNTGEETLDTLEIVRYVKPSLNPNLILLMTIKRAD